MLCNLFHSQHTKTLSKVSLHISVKSAENLHTKSTVLIILAQKGKFDPTKSKSTATSHAPKPISKQPHITQEMCYTYNQTEAVYLLTKNIEFKNKNAPALCRMDWCVVNGNYKLSVLVSTLTQVALFYPWIRYFAIIFVARWI